MGWGQPLLLKGGDREAAWANRQWEGTFQMPLSIPEGAGHSKSRALSTYCLLPVLRRQYAFSPLCLLLGTQPPAPTLALYPLPRKPYQSLRGPLFPFSSPELINLRLTHNLTELLNCPRTCLFGRHHLPQMAQCFHGSPTSSSPQGLVRTHKGQLVYVMKNSVNVDISQSLT